MKKFRLNAKVDGVIVSNVFPNIRKAWEYALENVITTGDIEYYTGLGNAGFIEAVETAPAEKAEDIMGCQMRNAMENVVFCEYIEPAPTEESRAAWLKENGFA